jgi:putative acetyltransferase
VSDPPFTIRQERPEDVDAIADVVRAAFRSPVEARLVASIRASEYFVPEWSLVAEVDGTVVGHVMVSYVILHDAGTEHRVTTLSPLAVAPEFERRGIGSALVREVAARVDAAGEPLITLEGNPTYYGRLGFEPAARLGIEIDLPSWAPREAAQVMPLRAHEPSIRGKVVYPPAFWDVIQH